MTRRPRPRGRLDHSQETIKALQREIEETHAHLDRLIAAAESVDSMIDVAAEADAIAYGEFQDALKLAKAFMRGDIL